jgi:hypothetical protein
MTDQHPITPPPELVQQWASESLATQHLCTKAARWGADQELEACCEQMKSLPSPLGIPFGEMASNALRAARRPKPPTDKELALRELGDAYDKGKIDDTTFDAIKRALEALPE